MNLLPAALGSALLCVSVSGCVADYDLGQTGPDALTVGTHTQLTTVYTEWPKISAERVAYLRFSPARVAVYDLATGVETIVSAAGTEVWYPNISGDRVVWLARWCVEVPPLPCAGIEYGLRMYDLGTGVTTDVVTQAGGSIYPYDIDGDALVYQAADGLHLRDLASGSDVMIASGNTTRRDLRIADGHIVWFEDPEILIHDIAVGTTISLPHSLGSVSSPDVSQGRVVFTGTTRSNGDVFVYDIALGSTEQLTRSGKDQILPRIAGDFVAYEESGHNDRGRVIDLVTGDDVAFSTISSTGEWNSPQVSESHVAYMVGGNLWAAELVP